MSSGNPCEILAARFGTRVGQVGTRLRGMRCQTKLLHPSDERRPFQAESRRRAVPSSNHAIGAPKSRKNVGSVGVSERPHRVGGHVVRCELGDRRSQVGPSTLRETNWVVGGRDGAAARLGVLRTTLIAKMRKLGISRDTATRWSRDLDSREHALAS